jgi:hypothetical protein
LNCKSLNVGDYSVEKHPNLVLIGQVLLHQTQGNEKLAIKRSKRFFQVTRISRAIFSDIESEWFCEIDNNRGFAYFFQKLNKFKTLFDYQPHKCNQIKIGPNFTGIKSG